MEEKEVKVHWFGKFTLMCILFGISPLLALFICCPYLAYHGCKSGAYVHCTDPSVNNFAGDIYGFGAWGTLLTAPAAFCLWVIVGVIALVLAKSNSKN